MRLDKPQTLFLLRGSLALIGMLLLWWLILVDPMLSILRVLASVPLSLVPGSASEPILAAPPGDWTIQIPVAMLQAGTIQRMFGQTADQGPMRIRFIKLKLPRSEIAIFTAGFPLYWAILLAAMGSNGQLRALLWGTALLSLVAVLSFLVYAGYTVETKLNLISGGLARWLLEFGEYLAIGVLPYMTPCLVALWLQEDLRRQVFSWTPIGPNAMPGPHASRKERRAAKRKSGKPSETELPSSR